MAWFKRSASPRGSLLPLQNLPVIRTETPEPEDSLKSSSGRRRHSRSPSSISKVRQISFFKYAGCANN